MAAALVVIWQQEVSSSPLPTHSHRLSPSRSREARGANELLFPIRALGPQALFTQC